MIREIFTSTKKRYEVVDITFQIEEQVAQSKVEEGICLVFVPHSTCGIILTENEERLKRDWITFLEKEVANLKFEHNVIDDNADSHILSGLLGQGKTLPIKNGKLVRGTWQQILLVELDGPKERKVVTQILAGK